jgi:predicted ferric reductase
MPSDVAETDVAKTACEPDLYQPYRAPWFACPVWGVLLCAAYPLLILTPLALFAILSPHSHHALLVEIGSDCALVAFPILAMQFVIAARLRWLEAPFGLDVVLQFHRIMAFVALVLLCAHPLLVSAGESWGLLTRLNVRWPIWAGRLAFLALVAHITTAVFRRSMRLRYETWRRLHNGAAFLLLGLVLWHSLALGHDFENRAATIIWLAFPLVAGIVWCHGRLARPWLLSRRPYEILSITPEARRVWTLTLSPRGNRTLDYAPGQFQFLRLHGSGNVAEDHPFSIASSPRPNGQVGVTVKESGDFTSTIGRLKPGDLATVHGPFGRFSHVLHSGNDLVFIAGGIGITPLMSMLRYMRDRRDPRRVLLIYANRTPADIVFRSELESMESGGLPSLKTIHVLSEPSADWAGNTGRLDHLSLEALCDGFSGKTFFLCCPPMMTAGLIRGLKAAGVAPERVHTDYFGL